MLQSYALRERVNLDDDQERYLGELRCSMVSLARGQSRTEGSLE
jgi:hypothetical protein